MDHQPQGQMPMPEREIEDRELVVLLQAGDLEALGGLFDRYRFQIYRTALAITRDTSAAEDILQECFLRVYHYADRINPELPLAPWLYRVTVNLSYTWSKKNKNYWAPLETFIDRLISPAKHAPEASAEHTELRERIQIAIDALPSNQQIVVVLHYLNGASLKEIAEILDCPVGTVKSRLFHARAALRDQLGHATTFLSDVAHGFI
jgi:RNA polymerase sigma-70 factor (ECF subfamily)